MGCFSYTCAISGLQIQFGTPIRLMVVSSQGSEPPHQACLITDCWKPVGYPLRGTYNDFGSIQDIQEGPLSEDLLETLRTKTIPRGVGENTCHDVAVTPSMGWDDFLEALWEGRCLLLSEFQEAPKNTPLALACQVLEGIPNTRADIDVDGRWVCVYTRDQVQTCLKALEAAQFSVAVEISPFGDHILRALYLPFIIKPYYQPRPLSYLLIREDVWKACIETMGCSPTSEQEEFEVVSSCMGFLNKRWMPSGTSSQHFAEKEKDFHSKVAAIAAAKHEDPNQEVDFFDEG